MMHPGFYPKPPAEVRHKETHISHLFFAGDLVYKVKKAVRFPFLDYSKLAKRGHFLSEELRLNRRLAPSVYLAIVPITTDGAGWQLGGNGYPVEYALVMRRLPEKRMLPFLLETHQVAAAMTGELAEVLARFHAQADRVRSIVTSYYPNAVENQWSDNLTDLRQFIGNLIDAETFGALKEFGTHFIDRHRDLLMRRAEQGWIRDVHGDLHCEHVCFASEGIQIFDCIEFSSKLRCCDLASEIAFLLMDLEVRGGQGLLKPFLTRYCQLLDDPELPLLLPYYKCYRALAWGTVEALRSQGPDTNAARYFRFAARFTWERWKPFLIMVYGLTGSGKSTLARELGERLGLPVINSDTVRKSIAWKPDRQFGALNEGIYNPQMTKKTYAKLAREAEKQILNGIGAILDATFGQQSSRQKILRLAEKHKVPLLLIRCSASEETTQRRLLQRATEGEDVSDGRWEIYAEQKAGYEPINEIPLAAHLELNTESPVEQLARSSERFLRSQLDRVRA